MFSRHPAGRQQQPTLEQKAHLDSGNWTASRLQTKIQETTFSLVNKITCKILTRLIMRVIMTLVAELKYYMRNS
jgi:hypothetical protein